ncbi:SusC/RagA family TonB-linked outer membrane protein [Spirosoma sordidisoli]|uniref:SusC/RagA family TonB-linked outer membrane protein n=2 Tax=Spirosoma sordidisoli TaxID=2502893 RepID=A0A4Q2UK77_9BACT|nr:SusC/RagA family TonB-linked outer membrane protein [Spirosoma sordidisoli]
MKKFSPLARAGLLLLSVSCMSQPAWSQTFASSRQVINPKLTTSEMRKLKDILQELKYRYQVDIIFEGGVVENVTTSVISINYSLPLEQNLNAILKPTHLRYKKVKEGSYLILDEKRDRRKSVSNSAPATPGLTDHVTATAMAGHQLEADAQSGKAGTLSLKVADQVVSGRVTDESGGGLPGVNILLKGTQKGTATDVQGNYTFRISEGNSPNSAAVLIFSFVGYLPQEIAVNNRSIVNVQLKTDLKLINEVVVVGYGTQKRSDITGAVGSISAKEIQDEPVVQIGQALQGKVAGLQVTQNSGAPGSGLLIRVRGTGTVNNSDPLYVVDGNLNSNPLDLVPDQIESIQVLKSASAAAIYGAQGANGVILITTKQGRAGKSQLDVSLSQGVQQIRKYFPVTNAFQYATLYNEGLVNAGQQPLYPNPSALGEGTNWQKEVFQVAPMTDVSLSASGGNENSKFFFSGGYINQEGIIKGSGFNRANLRINSSHTINRYLRVGQNLSGSLAQYKQISEFNFGSILGSTLTANPEIPVRMPDGNWGYSPTSLNSGNPLASINYTNNNTRRPVINGNVYAEIIPLEGLTFRSQYNFNIGYSENSVFNPAYRISTSNFNDVANLTESTSRFREYSWVNTLTYQKNIGDHTFDILGGVTVQESYTQGILAYAAGLPLNATQNPNLRYLNLSTQSNRVEGDAGAWGILSYLGRINYNYKSKYFTTVNFRADGSSRFGENNKFGYFPSFSLGWKLSEEPFLKEVTWVNNLMLRGGWGSLGNQNSLPNYAFTELVTPNINYTFGNPQTVVRGQAVTSMGNPDLRWESTKETNIGVDFTGFNNRVTASVDVYNKKTTDMLLQVPVVSYSGIQNAPYVNGGSVTNKGVELSLGYDRNNSIPGGFNYGVSGNIAFNQNRVNALSNSGTAINQFISFVGLVNVTQVGSPIASFWGWRTNGLFQSREEIAAHAFQSTGTAPGDIRFVDLDGNGVINANDQTVIGNPWPKFTYGLTSYASFKNLDFRMQLQGTYGNDIFMGLKFRMEGANFFNYTMNVWENRWTGPNTSNTVPRLNTNDPNNNMRSSEYYVEDGSYLRLRNIQIGYRIPKSVVNLRSLRVYASVQNALTFTKYPGFDPELGSNRGNSPLYIGIDETNYPLPRIYTLGVNIGL